LIEALKIRPLLLKGPGPVELGARAMRVQLKPSQGNERFKLQEHVKTLRKERRLFLVVGGLQATGAPGVVYNVYLNLKEGVTGREAEPHRVGSINFFAADMPPGAKAMAEKPGLVFDVTDLAKKMPSENGEGISVTIAPDGEPNPKARALVGDISFIER